jgi:superfamily II DNA/RNA helicase
VDDGVATAVGNRTIHHAARGGGANMSIQFSDLGLPRPMLDMLKRNDIREPFPIQASAIPDGLNGRDIAARAPTGSGKTLAFGLPILARVPVAGSRRPTALILAPTRELAAQIRLDLAPYAKAMNRQVFAVFGGVRYQAQKDWLNRGVDVLVATPGRLEDLIDQKAVNLSSVEIIAIDEADRMADMGFLPTVKRILDQTAPDRQTLLFSATLDGDVKALVDRYQTNPARHEVGGVDPMATDAVHHFWQVDHADKVAHTADAVAATGTTIVFVKTRHGTDRVAKQLNQVGVNAVSMHGGLSQNQRNRALKSFADGRVRALVATDVAARGIHVDDVSTVVHFDVPHGHKDYLHRSGRTARAGAGGTVVSIFTKPERRAVIRMQKNLQMNEPITRPRPESLVGDSGFMEKRPTPVTDHRPRVPKSERRTTKPSSEDGRQKPAAGAPGRRQKSTHTTRPANNGPMQDVYVGNLPWKLTDDDLRHMAGRYGTVASAKVKMDRRGRSKGVGFVTMSKTDASAAVHALNGKKINGRPLKVRFATPEPTR